MFLKLKHPTNTKDSNTESWQFFRERYGTTQLALKLNLVGSQLLAEITGFFHSFYHLNETYLYSSLEKL